MGVRAAATPLFPLPLPLVAEAKLSSPGRAETPPALEPREFVDSEPALVLEFSPVSDAPIAEGKCGIGADTERSSASSVAACTAAADWVADDDDSTDVVRYPVPLPPVAPVPALIPENPRCRGAAGAVVLVLGMTVFSPPRKYAVSAASP